MLSSPTNHIQYPTSNQYPKKIHDVINSAYMQQQQPRNLHNHQHYTSNMITAICEWFERHGKVIFVVAVFDILLIVFCVIYWNMELPVTPLRTTASWFPASTSSALTIELLNKYYNMVSLQLIAIMYIVYLLTNIQYNQKIILQNISEVITMFSEYKEIQNTNMQRITNQQNNALDELRVISDNNRNTTLHVMNRIKQEVRIMRMEYHNEQQQQQDTQQQQIRTRRTRNVKKENASQ